MPNDTVLTQVGFKAGQFRKAPRIERELGVSMLIGRQSVEEAMRYVLMGNPPTRQQLNRAVVRLTSVGTLREAGFAAVHTPGRVRGRRHGVTARPGHRLPK